MPLFNDGDITTIDDLRAYDSAILELSSAEGVDLSAKLRVAATEIGIELEEFLQKRMGGSPSAGIGHVVITPALKQWHTIHTLTLVYGDMFGNHMNQKYEGKWKEYKLRGRQTSATLFQVGIGLTSAPIPKPAAPSVRELGGNLPPSTYVVRVAWSNAAGETGAASDGATAVLETGGGFGVKTTRPPLGVIGFHVYAGPADQPPSKQNEMLVAIEDEWVIPFSGLIDGEPLPAGQTPDWFVRNDRVLQRG